MSDELRRFGKLKLAQILAISRGASAARGSRPLKQRPVTTFKHVKVPYWIARRGRIFLPICHLNSSAVVMEIFS